MNKILILAGGYSNEREISLITAKSVIKELKNKKYRILLTEPMVILLKNLEVLNRIWFKIFYMADMEKTVSFNPC